MQATPVRILLASLLTTTTALAQVEPNTSSLRFEVWDGTAWRSNITVTPGARIEYRAVVSYPGTSTVPYALGVIRYQPTFSSVDNDGPSIDTHAALRNNGISGSAIVGTMLSAAEGQSGSALPTYGRVTFGGIGTLSSTQNILTQFRHGGDFPSNEAPSGSWIRLAGNAVTRWPFPNIATNNATATNLNLIARGVPSGQAPRLNAVPEVPPNNPWVGGTQNLVVFRGALLLSDSQDTRTLTLSSAAGSQDRAGGVGSPDDTRFMTWQTSDFGGSFRSGVVVTDASIIVIPSPATVAPLLVATLFAARNRRNSPPFGHR